MMESLIKKFSIKGLFNQYNVNLSFDNKVSIFIGENGLGKTTILNCLYYVLSGNIERLNTIIFKEISITFSDGEELTINHEDITLYVEEYMYENSLFRRRRIQFDTIFSPNEIDTIRQLAKSNSIDEVINRYCFRISDTFGIPLTMARRELKRFITSESMCSANGDYHKVIIFKEKINSKLNNTILYFPTYRRIEEDMSKLGIDIEEDKVKNRLIQFGMSDVEKNIEKLLTTIKSIAITGFTKMTGILLKQYLNGELSIHGDYSIDKEKLAIALARIGDEIDLSDKERIIQLVNNSQIYDKENIYLMNLIKNLINSYEKQNSYDERIKKFVYVCNKYLNEKKYIYDESNVEIGIYRENSKKSISIQNLSSGEKQIISVFSKLYIEGIDNCIMLFDEPELSLSIKWQNMFLPDIIDSGRCATLIAVTHSPFIFENEFDELAKDMGDSLEICD